jgi:hypothetical protein
MGDDPILLALQKQLVAAKVVSRELTGCGFYLQFSVALNAARLHEEHPVKKDFCFGDIELSAESLERGAGFLLWIKNGALDCLEGYTYHEEWPARVEGYRLRYLSGNRRDLCVLRRQWELSV